MARIAASLGRLRDQVNAAYPNRNKASDGWIGDAAHQATASDHNPNAAGVVCALDITHDPANGCDSFTLADRLLANRHPDLKYLISNRRIAGAWTNWQWQNYNGSDPHTNHLHVSVGVGEDGKSTPPYDDTNDWAVLPAAAAAGKSNEQIAAEVMAGDWGNGVDRKAKLQAAGYDYGAIQAIVNAQVGISPAAPRVGNDVLADQVLAGAWGNGDDRKQKLTAAGYDYNAVQDMVNQKLAGKADEPQKLSDDVVADQVIAGAWGNGDDRRNQLQAAGYDYNAVQSIVNEKLGANTPVRKSDDQVANEVVQGSWGNGQERKDRLAAAGYDYGTVQRLVNQKLGF